MPDMFRAKPGRFSGYYSYSVVSSATVNTKGSWVQYVASTSFDACGLFIYLAGDGANAYLVDVGIGAAGSEVVLVANLAFQQMYGASPNNVVLPINIPAGTRISLRCQSNAASQTLYAEIALLGHSPLGERGEDRCTTYGVNTSTSAVQSLDPGGTAYTYSQNQITASLTNPVRYIVLFFTGQGNTTRTSADWYVQICIGASGSEVAVFEEAMIGTYATGDLINPGVIGPIPVDIPAGERLSLNVSCGITDTTDRLIGCAVYCFG